MEQRILNEIKQNLTVAIERLFGKIEELEQRLIKLEGNNEEGGSVDVEKSGADAVANVRPGGLDTVETARAAAEDAESVKTGKGEVETVTDGIGDEGVEESEYERSEQASRQSIQNEHDGGEEIHQEIEINWAGAESELQDEEKGEPGYESEQEEVQESEQESGRADWYDWEVDYPAAHIDNIYDGIGINDRYEFIRELFNHNENLHDAELLFRRTIDDLNRLGSFKEAVAYIRARFPQWDEDSDEVYRFYMIVRRKFN